MWSTHYLSTVCVALFKQLNRFNAVTHSPKKENPRSFSLKTEGEGNTSVNPGRHIQVEPTRRRTGFNFHIVDNQKIGRSRCAAV